MFHIANHEDTKSQTQPHFPCHQGSEVDCLLKSTTFLWRRGQNGGPICRRLVYHNIVAETAMQRGNSNMHYRNNSSWEPIILRAGAGKLTYTAYTTLFQRLSSQPKREAPVCLEASPESATIHSGIRLS